MQTVLLLLDIPAFGAGIYAIYVQTSDRPYTARLARTCEICSAASLAFGVLNAAIYPHHYVWVPLVAIGVLGLLRTRS